MNNAYLDSIFDVVLNNSKESVSELFNESTPTHISKQIQVLDAFKKQDYIQKRRDIDSFTKALGILSNFLAKAIPYIDKFKAIYYAKRGNIPAMYLRQGNLGKIIDFIYNKNGIYSYIKPFESKFVVHNLNAFNNELRSTIGKALDPEGNIDKSAEEMAYRALVKEEEFKNEPISELLTYLDRAVKNIKSEIDSLYNLAKGYSMKLDAMKHMGRNVVRDTGKVVGDIVGDVASELDVRLGESPADEIRKKRVEQAGTQFQDAPQPSQTAKKLTQDQLNRLEAARAGATQESIVDSVASIITEDPSLFSDGH